ncbi:MAG: cytochrome c5 family protein [Desulfuromonadales bacterium]|nr:cytochrome c5 family protein [Desulfuromonadales bacterium]
MLKGKDFALVIALGVLAFLAIASPKKVLIAEGFAISREELDHGYLIYENYCASCHQDGGKETPQVGDRQAWRARIRQGMPTLVRHAVNGFRGEVGLMPPKGGHEALTSEEVTRATAWMVQQSTAKGGG